jgi:Phytanoyl-CoA dioxygenase (PhyH)
MARMFSADHRRELEQNGFTRVESVIPGGLLESLLAALPGVSRVDLRDPSTWYAYEGIIPVHHSQAQWDIRQHPRLHQVFSELWQTDELWVTMDRVGFVPPWRPGCRAPRMHWDVDPRLTVTNYQAIVYLSDAPTDRAPFCTIPGVYRNLAAWLADKPPEWSHRSADFSALEMTPVPGRAGDLIIWNAKLPHGPGWNRSAEPRLMQAVSMFRAPRRGGGWPGVRDWPKEEQSEWWRTKRPPPWWRGVPLQLDPEPGPPAELSALGRRLVGLDDWPSAR